jgi:aminoglycoside phosphotransferase
LREGINLVQALDDASNADRHLLIQGLGRALRFLHSWLPVSRWPADWLTEALLVYGHGDFCLPNALADQGEISGVIDGLGAATGTGVSTWHHGLVYSV